MTVLAQLLIAAALVATAVIYGTDVFAAVVLRPALAHVDDRTLTGATGYMHDYADRRLPVPGAIGLAATVLGTAVAALAGHPGAVVAGGAAVLAMARLAAHLPKRQRPRQPSAHRRRPRRTHPG